MYALRKRAMTLEQAKERMTELNINTEVFDEKQLEELRFGLIDGVDVTLYADEFISWDTMVIIRLALKAGIDLAGHISSEYDSMQMEQIVLGIKAGIDTSSYENPLLRSDIMREIRLALEEKEEGVDITRDVSSSYTWMRLRELSLHKRAGVETSLALIDDLENYRRN